MLRKSCHRLCRSGWPVLAASLIALSACGDDDDGDGGGGGDCAVDDTQAPVIFGALESIVTSTGASSTFAPATPGFRAAIFDINNNCGLFGDAKGGRAIQLVENDVQDDAALAPSKTQELLDQGAEAIVQISGTPPTKAALALTMPAGIVMGACATAGDDMTGCTEAQIADPAITKVSTPISGDPTKCFDHDQLFYRAFPSGQQAGHADARWVHAHFPTATKVATILQSSSPAFINRGLAYNDEWVSLGLTVTDTKTPTLTQAALKTALMEIAVNEPEIVVMSVFGAPVKLLFQAYVDARDDPSWVSKPASFDSLKFVSLFTVSGTWNDLGAQALAFASSQVVAVTGPFPDTTADAYVRFQEDVWANYLPGETIPSPLVTGIAYDVTMVMALAAMKAGSTDGAAMAAAIQSVSSPDGEPIYPGEFKKARQLLMAGSDIDYVGTTGGVNIQFSGDVSAVTWVGEVITPTGGSQLLSAPTDTRIVY